jgi:hypothetical protein
VEAGRIGRPYTMGYGTVGRSGFTARTRITSLTAVVLTLPRGVSLCRDSGLYARPPTLGPVDGRGARESGCFLQAGGRVPRGFTGVEPQHVRCNTGNCHRYRPLVQLTMGWCCGAAMHLVLRA